MVIQNSRPRRKTASGWSVWTFSYSNVWCSSAFPFSCRSTFLTTKAPDDSAFCKVMRFDSGKRFALSLSNLKIFTHLCARVLFKKVRWEKSLTELFSNARDIQIVLWALRQGGIILYQLRDDKLPPIGRINLFNSSLRVVISKSLPIMISNIRNNFRCTRSNDLNKKGIHNKQHRERIQIRIEKDLNLMRAESTN